MTRIVIAGCGDIGRRIAALAAGKGLEVTGLVRSRESCEALEQAGHTCMQVDFGLPPLPPLDVAGCDLIYLAPPPRNGETDPLIGNFLAAMQGRPRRFLYLSTTGVYGDAAGGWIDESSPLDAQADRARRRLDAERQVAGIARAQGFDFLIIRVPGIYGPGRLPLDRIRDRQPVLKAEIAPFTNRIHADDLAAVTLDLLETGKSGEIYNVTDGNPSTMTDYFIKIARYAGLEPPPQIDMQTAREQLSPGMLSYLQESRRISNAKLMRTIGIGLRFPTLDDGLEAIFGKPS
ncbi:MAG: SDR family oxidoreductase [Sedimenticolaceae bacterium]|nr:SDR family oxidoreductase [Sedimenticolaceae bacterium]